MRPPSAPPAQRRKAFRSVYVLALVLLAAFRLVSYFNLDRAISARAGDTSVVAISERQRMLSQRVANLAQQLGTLTLTTHEQKRAALLGAISDMQGAQARLSDGASQLRRGMPLSPAARALYSGGPTSLNAQVASYLAGAQALASADTPVFPEALQALLADSETLLPRLDAATRLAQQQSGALLVGAHRLDVLSLAAMLLALLGSGLLLFLPAERRNERLLRDLDEQRAFLAAVLESLSEGLAVCDARGRLVLFRGVDGAGLPDENFTPERWPEIFPAYRPDGVTRLPPEELPLSRALRGEVLRDVELTVAPPGTPVADQRRPGVGCGGPPTGRGGGAARHQRPQKSGARVARRARLRALGAGPHGRGAGTDRSRVALHLCESGLRPHAGPRPGRPAGPDPRRRDRADARR